MHQGEEVAKAQKDRKMSRRKSDIEDLIDVTKKLPWWGGLLLALGSYLVLHAIASRPIMPPSVTPGQTVTAASSGLLTVLAMFGQIIFPFAFVVGALISGINSLKQKYLYNKVEARTDVSALNEMTWEDFEMLVSEYYRRQGFKVSREGGNGPDGGIDLVLRRDEELHLVQCKQWRAYKVGVQPVREFYGVMAAKGAAAGYFVTSGLFTADAENFVQGLNLELINGENLRKMIAAAQKAPVKDVLPLRDPLLKATPELAVSEKISSPLECPRCGAEMVKRVTREGVHAGKEFWGCRGYPKCRGTRDMEENSSDWVIVAPEGGDKVAPAPLTKSCPECSGDMKLRQYQTGNKSGQYFVSDHRGGLTPNP